MIISVILPTYKRPTLLPRAARSVITQALPANVSLQLVITDDDPKGSALAALPALQAAAPDNVQLYYVKRGQGAGGVARSRNLALSMSKGEWIGFLDDDDLLLDGALAALLQGALDQNAEFCAGAYEVVREDAEGRVVSQAVISPYWSLNALRVRNLFPIGSFLARRERLSAPFNPQLRTHEDWLFLLDNLPADASVALISKPVLQVRQAIDASREHRNETGGADQKAEDYARIYSLHPAPELAEQRQKQLRRLNGPSIDILLGHLRADASLQFQETTQGRFLICNPMETIQHRLLLQGEFEPLGARIAEAVVALRPGAIIDIGANIGVFSVQVARALPQCLVISLEPQRMVFMHLCANLLGNRLVNVHPHNLAVGHSEPSQTLSVPFFDVFTERYTGSVSLDAEVQRTRGTIEGVAEPSRWATSHDTVAVKRLDDLVDGLQVAFVKVDVEGMEEAVLRSGETLLSTQRPSLFFEAWSLPQFQQQRLSLLRFVIGHGYKVLQIGEDCFAYHPRALDSHRVMEALAKVGLQLSAQDK
jgi:FkbM family methyltransferase